MPLIISILTITLGCKNETQKNQNVLNVRIPVERRIRQTLYCLPPPLQAIVENLIFMPVYD